VCVGTLAFVKIPIVPVALLLSGCYLIARRRFGEVIVFGSALAVTIAAALLLLLFRSELWPFIETLKLNVAYSQGSLVEAQTAWGSLIAHFYRIYTNNLFVLLLAITLAVLIALFALSTKQYRRAGMGLIVSCCVIAVVSALAVLAVTAMWPHHNQILYIAAVFGALCLAPLFELTFMRARILTLCLMTTAAILLSGATRSHFILYVKAFKDMPKSIIALRELSPETQRLLASGPPGTYARLGINDQGHAFGLGEWKLACPKFHQYRFLPAAVLNEIFECISTVPTLIVAKSFRLVDDERWPNWDEFVGRVQRLLAADYNCDANEGSRICQRIAAP